MEEVLGAEVVDQIIQGGGFMKPSPDDKNEMYEADGGVLLPKRVVPPSTLQALKTWQARPDDVFVVSFPKAGTTWTQEIISCICNNGDLNEVNKSHTVFRVPFLEADLLKSVENILVPPTHEIVDQMKSPRTIKSHLPANLLPPDVMQKRARVVYVARNPKDVAVSFYNFSKWNPHAPQFNSWDEYFDDYYKGGTVFGSWWHHYLGFWSKRHEENVLFLKFEDMKKDLKGEVTKIATFLGYSFTNDVIDAIVSHCSFANMKSNPMTNPDTLRMKMLAALQKQMGSNTNNNINPNDPKKLSFMRKGKVGDWKNYFTVTQNEAIDALIEEKLAGSGLSFEN